MSQPSQCRSGDCLFTVLLESMIQADVYDNGALVCVRAQCMFRLQAFCVFCDAHEWATRDGRGQASLGSSSAVATTSRSGACSHLPPFDEPPSNGIHLPALTGCHLSPSAGTCSRTCVVAE
jgi:hypothetical protein